MEVQKSNTQAWQTDLNTNLNDQVSYSDFFKALGYGQRENIFIRTFSDRSKSDNGKNKTVDLSFFDSILPSLRKENENNRGVYFIVNGGGNSDPEVIKEKKARACFIDMDDYPLEEQLHMLQAFPLEPSIIIKTKKSLHAYWITPDGDIKYFRELQERLIQNFKSDRTIKNESRVMRLYGFYHCKGDPVMVKLIKFNPEITYTQRQLHEILPRLEKQKKAPKAGGHKSNERIKYGARHQYVISRLGHYVAYLPDTSESIILQTLYADFLENCDQIEQDSFEEFSHRYTPTIRKYLDAKDVSTRDPDHYKKAMRAWKKKNPGKDFDKCGSWPAAEEALLNDIMDAAEMATALSVKSEISSQEQQSSILVTRNGVIQSVFENYVAILRTDEILRGKIRHNALDGRIEVNNVPWDLSSHPIRDADLYNMRLLISEKYGIRNKEDLKQAISIVSRENCYHPVLEYLSGITWDNVHRIGELFPRYLGAERSDYTTAVTLLLLHGLIQRVRSPGVKFDSCVILMDKMQGTGKSTMCRFLALDDKLFSDELGDLSDGKKAYEAIRGKWVVELGELIATRRTKDIESIKAYLSRTVDNYREPYGIYSETYPRQCCFIGTTNKPQFLPDDRTGNRRFFPILCDGSKAAKHPLDDEQETREFIRQCYAEAIVIGETSGWQLTLDKRFDEELNALREQSTPEDDRVGRIQAFLDSGVADPVCSRLLWDNALHDGDRTIPDPTRFELADISEIMNTRITGWKRYRGPNDDTENAKYDFKSYMGRRYGRQRAWTRSGTRSGTADQKNGNSSSEDGFQELDKDEKPPF